MFNAKTKQDKVMPLYLMRSEGAGADLGREQPSNSLPTPWRLGKDFDWPFGTDNERSIVFLVIQ